MIKFFNKLSGQIFFQKVWNMKYMKIASLTTLFFTLLLNIANAGVNLPWSTTYNCVDWLTYGSVNCDGIEPGGGWTCNGQYEQITSAANYPNGAGGKGQRHWEGDGQNVVSGGTKISFNSPQTSIWLRWYMRYQNGFKWANLGYQKLIYFNQGCVVGMTGFDNFGVSCGGNPYTSSNGGGWDTIMANGGTYNGHKTSDGAWHMFEIHMTTGGVFQYWLDGVQKANVSGVSISSMSNFELMSNENNPSNGGCSYVDVDDIAISNTGYIGPLGGGTPLPSTAVPAAPLSLRVQ